MRIDERAVWLPVFIEEMIEAVFFVQPDEALIEYARSTRRGIYVVEYLIIAAAGSGGRRYGLAVDIENGSTVGVIYPHRADNLPSFKGRVPSFFNRTIHSSAQRQAIS